MNAFNVLDRCKMIRLAPRTDSQGSLFQWHMPAEIALAYPTLEPQEKPMRSEIRPVLFEQDGRQHVEYWSGDILVGRSTDAAPAGIELLLPGGPSAPVAFLTRTERDGGVELGPVNMGNLTLQLRITQRNPSLVERTLEVTAAANQRFAAAFPLESALDGELASFSGTESERVVYHAGIRERKNQVEISVR